MAEHSGQWPAHLIYRIPKAEVKTGSQVVSSDLGINAPGVRGLQRRMYQHLRVTRVLMA
jgi:hypothetical protein